MAILLSVPLQLFPAVRIMENGLFKRSGKMDTKVKWQKNIFRFVIVMFCSGLSWAGAADLDKFVAFIGSFAWCVLVLTILVQRVAPHTIHSHILPLGQCTALLCLPCHAALQGLRTHS